MLAVATALAYSVSAMGAARLGSHFARVAVWLAWVLHGLLLALCLFGQEPRFGCAGIVGYGLVDCGGLCG